MAKNTSLICVVFCCGLASFLLLFPQADDSGVSIRPNTNKRRRATIKTKLLRQDRSITNEARPLSNETASTVMENATVVFKVTNLEGWSQFSSEERLVRIWSEDEKLKIDSSYHYIDLSGQLTLVLPPGKCVVSGRTINTQSFEVNSDKFTVALEARDTEQVDANREDCLVIVRCAPKLVRRIDRPDYLVSKVGKLPYPTLISLTEIKSKLSDSEIIKLCQDYKHSDEARKKYRREVQALDSKHKHWRSEDVVFTAKAGSRVLVRLKFAQLKTIAAVTYADSPRTQVTLEDRTSWTKLKVDRAGWQISEFYFPDRSSRRQYPDLQFDVINSEVSGLGTGERFHWLIQNTKTGRYGLILAETRLSEQGYTLDSLTTELTIRGRVQSLKYKLKNVEIIHTKLPRDKAIATVDLQGRFEFKCLCALPGDIVVFADSDTGQSLRGVASYDPINMPGFVEIEVE